MPTDVALTPADVADLRDQITRQCATIDRLRDQLATPAPRLRLVPRLERLIERRPGLFLLLIAATVVVIVPTIDRIWS